MMPTVLEPRVQQTYTTQQYVILAMLLGAKSSVQLKPLAATINKLLPQQQHLDVSQLKEQLIPLRDVGLVEKKSQRLTPEGEKFTLDYLGLSEAPVGRPRNTILKNALAAKAMGVPPEKLKDLDKQKLAAYLLKRDSNLPVGAGDTLASVVEALACQKLGFPDAVKLKDVIPQLLKQKFDSFAPDKDALIASQLKGLFANDPEPVLEPEPEVESPAEEFDLEVFANTVKATARQCETGRFIDNTVFISHVWRSLQDHPQIGSLGLDGFKQKLAEANNKLLLRLIRADLVSEYDQTDIAESLTMSEGSAFHFIKIEGV